MKTIIDGDALEAVTGAKDADSEIPAIAQPALNYLNTTDGSGWRFTDGHGGAGVMSQASGDNIVFAHRRDPQRGMQTAQVRVTPTGKLTRHQ